MRRRIIAVLAAVWNPKNGVAAVGLLVSYACHLRWGGWAFIGAIVTSQLVANRYETACWNAQRRILWPFHTRYTAQFAVSAARLAELKAETARLRKQNDRKQVELDALIKFRKAFETDTTGPYRLVLLAVTITDATRLADGRWAAVVDPGEHSFIELLDGDVRERRISLTGDNIGREPFNVPLAASRPEVALTVNDWIGQPLSFVLDFDGPNLIGGELVGDDATSLALVMQ